MQELKNKVIVITGAGSGIGRALAIQLASRGARLALNDWNEEQLNQTRHLISEHSEVLTEAFDVGDSSSFFAFAQSVADHYGQVDVLINNAGIALEQRKTIDIPMEDFEKTLQVNLWGVIYGSRAFLPFLMDRPEAALVNISSIFGVVGQPLQSAYVTSKFAVRGFTEVLRNELTSSKVAITCVHPGGIRTNIIRNIATERLEHREKFAQAFEKMAKTSPDEAARQIMTAIQKKKRRLLIGRDALIMDILARLLPARYHQIIYRNFDVERFSFARSRQ